MVYFDLDQCSGSILQLRTSKNGWDIWRSSWRLKKKWQINVDSSFFIKLKCGAQKLVTRSWYKRSTGKESSRQGWLNARSRLRDRYHMALSLNEASEPARRFYRSAPASRFDALAITIFLFRCNSVSTRAATSQRNNTPKLVQTSPPNPK